MRRRRQKWTEITPVPANAADQEAADAHTMVTLGAADQFCPPAVSHHTMISASNLAGGINGLRAGIGKERV